MPYPPKTMLSPTPDFFCTKISLVFCLAENGGATENSIMLVKTVGYWIPRGPVSTLGLSQAASSVHGGVNHYSSFPKTVLGKVCNSEVPGSETNAAYSYLTQGSEQQEHRVLTCGWCLMGDCVGKDKGKGQKRNEGKQLCKDVEMKNKKPRRAGKAALKTP